MTLTQQEIRALNGTLELDCVDTFRQAVLLGRLPKLIFLIHAVLDHFIGKPDMSRAQLASKIAYAVDVGSVAELAEDPLALQTLNELAQQALVLAIPDS